MGLARSLTLPGIWVRGSATLRGWVHRARTEGGTPARQFLRCGTRAVVARLREVAACDSAKRYQANRMWLDLLAEKRHNSGVEAGIRELRDHLSRYLEVVRHGKEVTVTDHGKAVARLVPLAEPRAIDRLIKEGVISPAGQPKQHRAAPRIRANGTVSDLVAEQRR